MWEFVKNLLRKGVFLSVDAVKVFNWFKKKAPEPETLPPIKTIPEQFLDIARGEIGKRESGKNNAGPDVAKYKGSQDILSDLGPWCASGVSWCYAQTWFGKHGDAASMLGLTEKQWNARRHGAKALFGMFSRQFGAVKFGKENAELKPGMVVLWQRGALGSELGHIAIVSRVEGNHFWAIEFNRGGYPSIVKEFEHVLGEANLLGFAKIC